MSKQLIAIDLDDVLADSTESLRCVVNSTYGVQLEAHHYKVPGEYWKYYESVWETHGIADKVSKDKLNRQMVSDQSHVPVQAEAIRVLGILKERYDLVVLTARNPTWERATHVWLDMNFPGIFQRIVLGGQRDSSDQKTKGDICTEIGAAWLIDDNPSHCLSAHDRGIEAILFGEYGWHVDVPKHIVRCKDWKEIDEFFEST